MDAFYRRGTGGQPIEEVRLGLGDKIENAGDKLAGKAKEGTGEATNDTSLKVEGKSDQSRADLKQAGEHVKDAFK